MAVHDFDGALAQWRHVFGAGVMVDAVHDDLDGSDMGIVWMGDVPFLALAAADPTVWSGAGSRRTVPASSRWRGRCPTCGRRRTT